MAVLLETPSLNGIFSHDGSMTQTIEGSTMTAPIETEINAPAKMPAEAPVVPSVEASSEAKVEARADASLGVNGKIDFEDWQAFSGIVFEWADSYDNKDWDRLSKILAPRLLIDYSIVGHERRDDIPASEYLEMMKSPMFLGDPLIRTQHLMGASRYERISDNEAVGHHQIRAAHQRYKPDGVTVENRGHGHSFVKHWYTKVDGEWKLSGLRPEVYWNEHSFDKIFLKLNAKP